MGKHSQDNDDGQPVKTAEGAVGEANAAAKSREARRAEELRRNLQRRKVQQRDRRSQSS